MISNKVLPRVVTPTQTSYREAVRDIILSIQGGMTDEELGDRLGCSSGTVGNARNRKGNLCGATLARIGHEFGPESLAPFMALSGGLAIRDRADAANDLATIAGISHVAGDWIEKLKDGRRCHRDTAELANSLRPLVAALSAVIQEAEAA